MNDFFTDVISADPRFNSLSRIDDPLLLEPVTRTLVEGIISQANAIGIQVMIYETYRSQDRQKQLFAQGATQLRIVGVHHYGLACDIVKVIDGSPSWKGDFSFLGALAHSAGLIWGGDWGNPQVTHTFVDNVHLQRCTVARQPELFAGTWYPDDSYNPYQDHLQPLFASLIPMRSAQIRPKKSRKKK